MKRREFITLVGGAAAAWPVVARAQQPGMPVIGFLVPGSVTDSGHYAKAFAIGLKELGYIDGQSISIDYRWAEGQYQRLVRFAADLVGRGAAVIVAGGPPSILAAKAATSTVPIIGIGVDMGRSEALGLVDSLNRPKANVTGFAVFDTAEIYGKRLSLLHELMPKAAQVAMLINPGERGNPELNQMETAARSLGMQLSLFTAETDAEIDAAYDQASAQHLDALLVSGRPFFTVRRDRLIALAARHTLTAVYAWREYVAGGGLISYGSDLADAFRQAGLYVGRILKGERTADLPVVQPTKFQLAINLKTAKALGLAIPDKLLALADEVIE